MRHPISKKTLDELIRIERKYYKYHDTDLLDGIIYFAKKAFGDIGSHPGSVDMFLGKDLIDVYVRMSLTNKRFTSSWKA